MRGSTESDSIVSVRHILDFSGRVVVVTGAGSGLGRGIALRFAEAGAAVAVHYHRSADGAHEVVQQIEARGGPAVAISANLAAWDEAERLMHEAEDALGRIDILVNNAGAYPLQGLLEMTETEWDAVITANLHSVAACTRAAAARMIEQGAGGSVVNIASIEAVNPALGHSHYGAAKAGVVAFTRGAANELGRHGVRVNALSPGLIRREGIEVEWPEGVARFEQAAPLGRLGQPEDVADACLFLASPGARWITGANLVVDGGVMTNQVF